MLISIITINYNNKQGLQNTIESVLKQKFSNFEYVVIDGNSKDGSKDIIESNKDHFSYSVSENDTGIYNAMNKGVAAAKGKYLLFLNSGDTLYDDTVLNDVAANLETDLDIYYGNLQLMHESNTSIKSFPQSLSFSYFFDNGYLPHPSTFIKRSLFESVYRYNEDFKLAADWDFLVAVICKHNASYKYMNRVVTVFDKNGISSNPESHALLQKEKQQSLKNNFPLFYEDSKRLMAYDNNFKFDRFKMLKALEKKPKALKLTNLWLKLLTKFFKISD